jgi:translation elongation factor EF-1alpha
LLQLGLMEELIGKISHYFGHLEVAAMKLTGTLRAGDTIHVKGHTTDFTQPVDSLEVEHQKVDQGGPGQDVAFKVKDKARTGDEVFKVS